MEKKRQAEYNRWKAECNPVWHRRNHWLPKYEEEGTWEDSRAYNVELGCDLKGYVETVRTYNAAGELIRTEEVTFDNSKELSRNSHGNCENNTGKRRMRSVWNMATTASGVYYVVLLKVTLYLIRLSAAVQAAELQIDTAGSI